MNQSHENTQSQSELPWVSVSDLLLSSTGEASSIPEDVLSEAMESDDDLRTTASMLALLELVGAEIDDDLTNQRLPASPWRIQTRWLAMAACLVGLVSGAIMWSNRGAPIMPSPAPALVRISLPPVPSNRALSDTSNTLLLAATTKMPPPSLEPRQSSHLAVSPTSWIEREQALEVESTLKIRTWR